MQYTVLRVPLVEGKAQDGSQYFTFDVPDNRELVEITVWNDTSVLIVVKPLSKH